MKKGFLAAVTAIALAFAAPVTALADDSTPSSTTDDAKIVINKTADADGLKVGDSAATVNAKWGTNFDASLVVVFTGDAVVVPEGGVATGTFSASQYGGTIIVHKGSTGIAADSTITISSSDLSPVIVLGPASSDKVPNTGDSNNNGLWIGALGLSVVLAGAAIFMRKRTA